MYIYYSYIYYIKQFLHLVYSKNMPVHSILWQYIDKNVLVGQMLQNNVLWFDLQFENMLTYNRFLLAFLINIYIVNLFKFVPQGK